MAYYKARKKHKTLSTEKIPRNIDMHVHTLRSIDGEVPVYKVLDSALANNVSHLAIADHNNIDGVKKALRFIESEPNKFKNLNLINGVEISCYDQELGAKFHLLVYDFDINNEKLNALLKDIQKSEKEVYYALFAILEKNFNITFSPYLIKKTAAINNEITLDVIAEMAVLHVDENGKPAPYATTKEEFLEYVKKSLSINKFNYENKEKIMADIFMGGFKNTKMHSLEEVFTIIKEAGGVPVLAHPKHITFFDESGNRIPYEINEDGVDITPAVRKINKDSHNARVKQFLEQFSKKTSEFNLDAGMEVFFPAGSFESEYYMDLAKKFNLIPSGGSDFHGLHKSLNHRIGTIANRYYITKLPIIEYLNNGRIKSSLHIPDFAQRCIAYIDPYITKKYASKNEGRLAKVRLKKASDLNAVLSKFGKDPMPVHNIYSRAVSIRKRSSVLETEQDLVNLLKNDNELIIDSKKSKSQCNNNIKKLERNFRKLNYLLHSFKKDIEILKLKDKAENKESFINYLNGSYANLKKQVMDNIFKRKEMYANYDIDIIKIANELKKERELKTDRTTTPLNKDKTVLDC